MAILEFLVTMLLAYLISKSISKPLNNIMISIQEAKEGKIKAGEDDELSEVSRSFNDMMENLGSLICNTKDTSSNISNTMQSVVQVSQQSYAASEEIAATMNEVAAGAQSQADGVSNTVTYVNNLFDGINQFEISLKDTKGVSVKISDSISELNNYMKEIENMTKLIVGISEQANLLALNASIEAARAGDVGRGFTIVSEQVKRLAIQSKEATNKINKIIDELTKKIMVITQIASKTQTTIAKQDEAIEETNSTALSIISSMEGVSENITQLMGYIEKIYGLKGDTLSSIEGISAVSEETAAITKEVTATTQEQIVNMENLSDAATSLNEMIQKLNSTLLRFEV